jgi:peptidyl-prolyl cis-trans isomerase SurA
MKNIKKLKNIFLGFFVTAMLSSANAEAIFIDQAVAIANDEVILQSELNSALERQIISLKNKGVEITSFESLRKNVLEQLIIQSLIFQLAKKNSLEISETEIDRAIELMAKSNNMSINQLIAEAKNNGYTESSFRKSIKYNIISSEVTRSQVRNRIQISEQETKQLAITLQKSHENQLSYHLANIFIKVSPSATPAQLDRANRKINTIIKAHNKGESFASLAQKYSEAPNAIEGGELGKNLNINEMPQEIAQIIENHEVGDIVGPLKIQDGLLLIKIYDKGYQTLQPIEQVKVRHILLTTNIIFDDDKARSQLEQYRQDIINGDSSFDELARTHSQDPGSSFNGGLMDWMNPDVFDPRFKMVISTLEIGQISEPFKSSFGWHIAMVEDRKVDSDSLEAYKIKAREILTNRSLREETEKWERELRDSSYVKILE